AVEHRGREDHGIAKLSARATAVSCDPRQPEARTAAPAGNRGVSFKSVERGRHQSLYRASAAPSRMERRSPIDRRLLSVDLPVYRRRAPSDQHLVLEASALRFLGGAAYADGDLC